MHPILATPFKVILENADTQPWCKHIACIVCYGANLWDNMFALGHPKQTAVYNRHYSEKNWLAFCHDTWAIEP